MIPEKDRQAHYAEVRSCVLDLMRTRPQYMHEAKERAERWTNGTMEGPECPMCADDTKTKVRYILPPLNPHPKDKLIDSDWIIKCTKCEHEDWFTLHYRQGMDGFDKLDAQRKIEKRKQIRANRKKRSRKR